ncbi:putative phage major capsid protein E [Escherichia coli 180200]|nr:putative phage major capsid protein E [Escherichia coli 180200]
MAMASSCIPDSTWKTRQKELPAGQHDGAGEHSGRGLRTYGCIQDADAQREGLTPLPVPEKLGDHRRSGA